MSNTHHKPLDAEHKKQSLPEDSKAVLSVSLERWLRYLTSFTDVVGCSRNAGGGSGSA